MSTDIALTSVNITTRHHARIDYRLHEYDAGRALKQLSYNPALEDFAMVSGTPASEPYIEFWCHDRKTAEDAATQVIDILAALAKHEGGKGG